MLPRTCLLLPVACACLVIAAPSLAQSRPATAPATTSAPATASAPAPAPAVPFDQYDGYFVVNTFEPNHPRSLVVLTDQAAFNRVFGAGFVMNDRSHRLPPDLCDKSLVIAKWLARGGRLLIVDEPTRGVDVGAKAAIHHLLDELASQGVAIMLISSELPEVVGICSRVLVMREGRLVGEVPRAEATQEKVLRLMAGVG